MYIFLLMHIIHILIVSIAHCVLTQRNSPVFALHVYLAQDTIVSYDYDGKVTR